MFPFSLLVDDRTVPDLENKLQLCNELQIPYLELHDVVDGQSIAEWDGEQTESCRHALIRHHKQIVLLNGSRPASDYDYYRRLLAKALQLRVASIRIAPAGAVDETDIAALRKLVESARLLGIGIIVENDASVSGVADDRSLAVLYSHIRASNTGIAYNPLEFVRRQAHPFFHAFYNSKLKSQIRFLRVNDGLFADGRPVLPGEGNAEVKELASILLKRSYKGYFSFTPYMPDTDIAVYRSLLERFKHMLTEL